MAHTGREAIDLAESMEFHASVIDLGTPIDDTPEDQNSTGDPRGDGMWLLELLRLLPKNALLHCARWRYGSPHRVLSLHLLLPSYSGDAWDMVKIKCNPTTSRL